MRQKKTPRELKAIAYALVDEIETKARKLAKEKRIPLKRAIANVTREMAGM